MYRNMKRKLVSLFALLLTLSACSSDVIGPAPNGDACEVDEDCESEVCVTALGSRPVPDGLCTAECLLETDEGCTDAEICLRYRETGEDYCYPTCGTSDDCRDGFVCVDFLTDPRRACVPSP